METTIKNDIEFEINTQGLPLYQGQPLGCLKWGHPALISWFGEHYRSSAEWEAWWANWKPSIDTPAQGI